MRRLVLIVLMCLLPLQWSWAAAASVCGHENDQQHFGHHEHAHVADADGAPAHDGAAAEGSSEGPGAHPDCQVCHGMGTACMQQAGNLPAWSDPGALPAYADVLPEPPVESFLRPPLSLVA